MTALVGTLVAQQQPQGSLVGLLLPLVALAAIFYFMLIRPQQRRMREQRALLESLQAGDEVLTVGGIYGTVRSIQEDEISLEISPGTTIRIVNQAVARKVVDTGSDDEGSDGGS